MKSSGQARWARLLSLALLSTSTLLCGAANAYTIEALASAFFAGNPDAVALGGSTTDTATTQLFFDTGVVTSTFGTGDDDPPSTARGLARASLSPMALTAFELGVLSASTGGNLVSHAGARASVSDVLTVSLPVGMPSTAIGVTFTVNGLDQSDGGLIDEFLASILVGPIGDPRGTSWGAGDLVPDPFTGEISPLVFSDTFTVSDGQLVTLSSGIDARTDGSRTLDFSSTGAIAFALPPGVALTSQTGIAIVPEPSSLGLLGLALLGLVVQRRLRDPARASRTPFMRP